MDVPKLAGLDGPDQKLPNAVRVKHGVNRDGKSLHYYLNFSQGVQSFEYPYNAGQEVLTQTPVANAQTIALQPWDEAMIEVR